MAQRIQENRKRHLQENGSRYSSAPRYFKEPPAKLTKLRDGQEWKNKKGNIWEKDRKHKGHYDVTNPKTGKRLTGLIIMVTKYHQMDLKIKQKIMQQPYKKYEQDKTWAIVNNLINDLLDNNDIELQTPIEYVVGYICKGLLDSNNLNRSCQKKNNKY